MVAPSGNDAADTVTIGSVMPYRVTGDIAMHQLRNLGVLNYSQFTKVVSAGGTLHNALGVAAPVATDSAFSVAWGTIGAQTVSVTEVPQVVSGPAFCAGNTQILNVVVVNRPTAVWNGAASATGCGVAGTTVTIPYRLSGAGAFEVSYNILYTPLSGAASQVVPLSTDVLALGSHTANGTQDFTFSYSVPAAAYGRYDVTIETVNDRFSRKSGVASVAADVPAAVLTFYAYPTPATQPINHLQNL
jgi:hypothetical protein